MPFYTSCFVMLHIAMEICLVWNLGTTFSEIVFIMVMVDWDLDYSTLAFSPCVLKINECIIHFVILLDTCMLTR